MLEDPSCRLALDTRDRAVGPTKVLFRTNLKLLRKMPVAPKYVSMCIEFTRLIKQLANEKDGDAEFLGLWR